jgi:hypothetical protein
MEQFLANNIWLITLVVIWTLPWKGLALWRAARRGEQWWFICLLVINTLAILEILYIFVFSRQPKHTPPAAPSV